MPDRPSAQNRLGDDPSCCQRRRRRLTPRSPAAGILAGHGRLPCGVAHPAATVAAVADADRRWRRAGADRLGYGNDLGLQVAQDPLKRLLVERGVGINRCLVS
jgi:hypothetical protein